MGKMQQPFLFHELNLIQTSQFHIRNPIRIPDMDNNQIPNKTRIVHLVLSLYLPAILVHSLFLLLKLMMQLLCLVVFDVLRPLPFS